MAAPDGRTPEARTPEAKTLYVGQGVTIKGAVVVCDTVVVDGDLEGDIQVENLLVGATGAVTGRIKVGGNADIAGGVFDRIEVKGLLIMRAGGRLEGNISFGTLTMERGASITGEVSPVDYRTNLQSLYRANQQPAQPPQASPSATPAPQQESRPGAATAPLKRLDLSALDEMPGPFAATA
jgi:cytoskeletal protein CcmA (bactofilin family)